MFVGCFKDEKWSVIILDKDQVDLKFVFNHSLNQRNYLSLLTSSWLEICFCEYSSEIYLYISMKRKMEYTLIFINASLYYFFWLQPILAGCDLNQLEKCKLI